MPPRPCLKRVCDPLFIIGRSLGLCSAFLLAVSDTVPAMPNANLLCPMPTPTQCPSKCQLVRRPNGQYMCPHACIAQCAPNGPTQYTQCCPMPDGACGAWSTILHIHTQSVSLGGLGGSSALLAHGIHDSHLTAGGMAAPAMMRIAMWSESRWSDAR